MEGERGWKVTTWWSPQQNHRQSGLLPLDRWNPFLKSWQMLPSEGIFQRTYGSILGRKNPGRIGKKKTDCDVITQERTIFMSLHCSHPPYFYSDKIEGNSPRGKEGERSHCGEDGSDETPTTSGPLKLCLSWRREPNED